MTLKTFKHLSTTPHLLRDYLIEHNAGVVDVRESTNSRFNTAWRREHLKAVLGPRYAHTPRLNQTVVDTPMRTRRFQKLLRTYDDLLVLRPLGLKVDEKADWAALEQFLRTLAGQEEPIELIDLSDADEQLDLFAPRYGVQEAADWLGVPKETLRYHLYTSKRFFNVGSFDKRHRRMFTQGELEWMKKELPQPTVGAILNKKAREKAKEPS